MTDDFAVAFFLNETFVGTVSIADDIGVFVANFYKINLGTLPAGDYRLDVLIDALAGPVEGREVRLEFLVEAHPRSSCTSTRRTVRGFERSSTRS